MKRALVLIVVWCGAADAQPAPVALAPITADSTSCLTIDTTPGASLEPPTTPGELQTPVPWTELVVEGELIDGKDTVHALLEPTLTRYRTSLTANAWPDIAAVTAKFGYQLVGHAVNGERLVLHLAPLPAVRKVDVEIDQSIFDKLFDDEVRRRMRVRKGSYLPWESVRRQCALIEERDRILDFLHDEGYFAADVAIIPALEHSIVKLVVRVDLGKEYTMATPKIGKPEGGELAIPDAEVQAVFVHKPCILFVCFGEARFTRTQHQEDLRAVKELFHKRGYPAVRVQSSFDPTTSFDRRSRTVKVTLTIDQRRNVDYKFDGNDLNDDDLRTKLTFDKAGSSDELEAMASARELETYFQTKGYFDARVTQSRESLNTNKGTFDRITFHVEPGQTREVATVEFVGNDEAVMKADKLRELVATKATNLKSALLGTTTSATSVQLAKDHDRIVEAYRRIGYRDTTVDYSVSTDPAGLGDAALTAALLEAQRGDDLHVRFTIHQGEPTLLSMIELVEPGPDKKPLAEPLCDQLLGELAFELGPAELATRTDPTRCLATATHLELHEDDVATTKDRLRDFLFRSGRPRAVVELAMPPIGPHRVAAIYAVSKTDELKIGKVVIRGAFVTRERVIAGELRFHEGQLLTTDALADGARRLRQTGLFDAVNIDMPDLDSASEVVNAVVRVEERYDYLAQVDLEGGYSSVNGLFGTVSFAQRNLFGIGLSWVTSFTYGQKIKNLESTLRVPRWLMPLDLQAELTGRYNTLLTPRFGLLTTEAVTAALSRSWPRPRTETHDARTITATLLRYDFRLRTRNVDALRPIGANMDEAQVAISTQTGSVGASIVWDQRVDRSGQLSPLSPEAGFRLEAAGSIASPYIDPCGCNFLRGQDTFVKVSGSASKFQPVGKNLVLRGDLRFDQGIPLGGAVLLPEVERFFAGGDSTVRGYADDRMATEIIQVGVPPVSNLSQIRVFPAGGNIRVLGSVDGQVRIWKILAGALFADAGMITNQWSTVTSTDIRPSVGMGLRALTPFGIGALEYAVPLRPQLGDDPRGRIHFYFAARAQF